jgi:hypothetical protein
MINILSRVMKLIVVFRSVACKFSSQNFILIFNRKNEDDSNHFFTQQTRFSVVLTFSIQLRKLINFECCHSGDTFFNLDEF